MLFKLPHHTRLLFASVRGQPLLANETAFARHCSKFPLCRPWDTRAGLLACSVDSEGRCEHAHGQRYGGNAQDKPHGLQQAASTCLSLTRFFLAWTRMIDAFALLLLNVDRGYDSTQSLTSAKCSSSDTSSCPWYVKVPEE